MTTPHPPQGERTYFFGVIDAQHKGHFLYDRTGQSLYDYEMERQRIPFKAYAIDGGLLVQPETQGRLHLSIVNGWTVLGMWDRTADTRSGCSASFIAEGVHSIDEMKAIAARDFPVQWKRIQGDNP